MSNRGAHPEQFTQLQDQLKQFSGTDSTQGGKKDISGPVVSQDIAPGSNPGVAVRVPPGPLYCEETCVELVVYTSEGGREKVWKECKVVLMTEKFCWRASSETP